MKKMIQLLFLLCSYFCLKAQTPTPLNQVVSPKVDLQLIVLKYYGINFNAAQKAQLEGKEIELLYLVDTLGKPMLQEVNGIDDTAIIDSLVQKTSTLGHFHPQIQNGSPVTSIFGIKFTFPSYQKSIFGLTNQRLTTQALTIADFEFIKTSNQKFTCYVGVVTNQFLGRPSSYLALGGGFKTEITYTTKKDAIIGLTTSFYGNRAIKPYPLATTRAQLSGPITLLVGMSLGKNVGRFIIQGEANMAIQNVTEKLGNNDKDWVQLKGWSPGVVAHYPIQVGKKHISMFENRPTLVSRHLDIHMGLRYLGFSLREASGLMTEFGVSYKLDSTYIDDYALRNNE